MTQPANPTRETHPLIHAGKWVASDLFSTLIFVGLYALSHNVYLATGIGIGLGVGQIAWLRARGQTIDPLQWMSLGLVVVFGGATLVTHNPLFILLKPTLIYCAVGAVMLRPGWMTRYLPAAARSRGADITNRFGYVWAGLMFVTAAANLAFALHGDVRLYAWFLFAFPLGSKIVLILTQYGVTRIVVRRRMAAEGAYRTALATS